MRLHRFIAQCGVTSRRKAEDLIREGRVQVNGGVVTDMGVAIDPEKDHVQVDGQDLEIPRHQYFLFNKPRGVVTTLSDPNGRRTVADYFPSSVVGLKPVGRLDMNTEGLMVLTNDGDFAARLTHAKWGVEKEYEAQVKGLPDKKDLARLQKGVWIEGGKTSPAKVAVISHDEAAGTSKVMLAIHEGRKHQVRLMFAAVGHEVVSLKRVRIGPFLLKGLRSGEMKTIGLKEVRSLLQALGHKSDA